MEEIIIYYQEIIDQLINGIIIGWRHVTEKKNEGFSNWLAAKILDVIYLNKVIGYNINNSNNRIQNFQ